MKKFFTLIAAIVLAVSTWAATETTVYYAIPSATVGSYTVKLNVNRKGDGNDWKQYDMTLTGETYNNDPIYSCTFTDLHDGLGVMQFQLYDGSTWKSQEQPISSWTYATEYNGKMRVYNQDGWINIPVWATLSANASYYAPGDEVTLTATAAHFSGTVSYEFQYSTDGGETYTAIAAASTDNTKQYTITDQQTYQFKVVASSTESGETESAAVTVAPYMFVVAGNSTELFGETWAGIKAENQMTYNSTEAVFEKSYSFASLTYAPAFKVVRTGGEDHAWLPDGDNLLVSGFDIAANYSVAFTYNPSTGAITGVATPLARVALASNYSRALINNAILLTATPAYFSDGDISYEFYYSKDGADYVSCGDASTSATFAFTPTEKGNYTFKVVATLSTETAEAISGETEVADAWTIAGDAALTGYNWDAEATANNMSMTADDGILTLVQNNRFIPAGTFHYKAYINHVKDAAQYPANSNNDYTFNKAGYYNLVYTFDWKNWSLELEPTFIAPKVQLLGEFNDWANGEMTTTDGENFTLAVSLTADEYMFRVRRNEAANWNGTAGDGRMLRTNCTDWELSTTEEGAYYNCGLIADLDGEYVFNYNFTANELTITYPMTFSRTVSNTNYGTLCLPCAATLTGATAYTIDEVNLGENGYITIEEVEGKLVAGKAYIIKPEAIGTITAELEGAAVAEPESGAGVYLNGNWGDTLDITSTFVENQDPIYKYVLYNNQLCKLEGTSVARITSTKAYFQVPEVPGSPSAPSLLRIVEGENNATDLSNTLSTSNATKFFRNGVLYILRDGVTYDAMGKQVK